MGKGLSEENGGHRSGSLGGAEMDEWCQQTEPGFKEKRKVPCPQATAEGGCSLWNRGSQGHWKSSAMRAVVGAGVRGENRSRLEVCLWEQVQRCPRWSRLALPYRGCSVFTRSVRLVVE